MSLMKKNKLITKPAVEAARKKLLKARKQLAEAQAVMDDEILEKDRDGLFFTFNQNNSGGNLVVDDNVCECVIVEAEDAEAANVKAQKVGIYFDGSGDCPCCGNRWYEAYGDGDKVPSEYGKPIEEQKAGFYRSQAYVYYADGTKKVVKYKDD